MKVSDVFVRKLKATSDHGASHHATDLEVWRVSKCVQVLEGPTIVQFVEHVDLHRAQACIFSTDPVSKRAGGNKPRM